MLVIAAPGIQVPKEHQPRDYITAAQALEVPDTPYYCRRLADGDLLIPPSPPGGGDGEGTTSTQSAKKPKKPAPV